MDIRHAQASDVDAITALEAACFPPAEAAGRASFAARVAAFPECFWLGEQDGRLVSAVNGMATDEPDLDDAMFADAGLHKPDGAWQMIFGVATLPAMRRRGLAASVMRRMIADSRARGRKGVVLTCKEALVPFYARLGFADEGLSPSTHGGAVWHSMRLVFAPQA